MISSLSNLPHYKVLNKQHLNNFGQSNFNLRITHIITLNVKLNMDAIKSQVHFFSYIQLRHFSNLSFLPPVIAPNLDPLTHLHNSRDRPAADLVLQLLHTAIGSKKRAALHPVTDID